MNFDDFNKNRKLLNTLMMEKDAFFKQFAELDSEVYAQGAIPAKYKELTGLSISILTRCEECIMYHLQGCLAEKASRVEIFEAIKMGVIGVGSVTFPSARFAFQCMAELNVI